MSTLTAPIRTAITTVGAFFRILLVVFQTLRDIYTNLQDIAARARAAAGLPVPNPTRSFWQEDPPFPELVRIQSSKLPAKADVVIIGSGITGAAVSRSIFHEHRRLTGTDSSNDGETQTPPPRVVVLEARELCSGATGRNGGQIKSIPHGMFARLLQQGHVSPERAAALVRFQMRHLDVLLELCAAEDFALAECRAVETVDLFLDENSLERARKEVADLEKWIPEFQAEFFTAEETRKKFGTNDAVLGSMSYKAGALWPYRLVMSVWDKLLRDFPEALSVETNTAVHEVTVTNSKELPFQVITEGRGTIRARHVVHATNAFATQLVPGLRGKMTGILCHMSSQKPGTEFPGSSDGSRSWSILYGGGFDYIVQRPNKDGVPGELMAGGGFATSQARGADMVGLYDDSKMDALTNAHNLGIMPSLFEPNWGPAASRDGDGKATHQCWSGVVSLTADSLPLVGRLDPRLTGRKSSTAAAKGAGSIQKTQPGEWVAASYNGDGMVWAWLCGTALGVMLAGSEDDDAPGVPGRPAGGLKDWFPEELLPSRERLGKIDIVDLADDLS